MVASQRVRARRSLNSRAGGAARGGKAPGVSRGPFQGGKDSTLRDFDLSDGRSVFKGSPATGCHKPPIGVRCSLNSGHAIKGRLVPQALVSMRKK
jgi:hypothetical protein